MAMNRLEAIVLAKLGDSPRCEQLLPCHHSNGGVHDQQCFLEQGHAGPHKFLMNRKFDCPLCGCPIDHLMAMYERAPHLSGEDEDNAGELREKLRYVRRELLQYKSHFGVLPKEPQKNYEL